MPDQVNNLLQNKISLRHGKSDRKCLTNKAADLPMNPIPSTKFELPIDSQLKGIDWHKTRIGPENVVQDYGEVYNIAHYASNILLAGMRGGLSQINEPSWCSLTFRDICHGPIPRTCLQIHVG